MSVTLILSICIVSSADIVRPSLTVTNGSGDVVGSGLSIYVTSFDNPLFVHIPFSIDSFSQGLTLSLSLVVIQDYYSVSSIELPFSSYASLPFYGDGDLLFNVPVTVSYFYKGVEYSYADFRQYLTDNPPQDEPSDFTYDQRFTFSNYDNYSALYDQVDEIVLQGSIPYETYISVEYDLKVENPLFSGLTMFITGIWCAVLSVISGIGAGTIVSVYMWFLPLFGVAFGFIFKVVGKKRKRR